MSVRQLMHHFVDSARRLTAPMGQERSLARHPVVLHAVGGYSYGGAAKGAFNLHRALIEAGCTSRVLLQFSRYPSEDVMTAGPWHSSRRRIFRILDALPLKAYSGRHSDLFSPGWVGLDLRRHALYRSADIIHLHWVSNGFLDLRLLPLFEKPVVWTLRDMWPFTGGCHYTYRFDCDRYQQECGRCPHLGSRRSMDLSWLGWRRKHVSYARNLHPVAISGWLGERARESSLLRHHSVRVIHNCIDTDVFRPVDTYEARERLGLPPTKQIVLFGANSPTEDRRKGFPELLTALSAIRHRAQVELITFGGAASLELASLGIPNRSMGRIEDASQLALLYSAADLFVAPSLQEAFGKTVAEAMACGTPVVTFRGTGPSEIVEHHETGYLCEAGDAGSLALGIDWLLSRPVRENQRLRRQARERAIRCFGLNTAARAYMELYQELLAGTERRSESPGCK